MTQELRKLAEDFLAATGMNERLQARFKFEDAANPAAVLALLDRVERAEKDAERLLPLLKLAHSVVEGSYSEEYDQGFEELVSAALFTEIQAIEASK